MEIRQDIHAHIQRPKRISIVHACIHIYTYICANVWHVYVVYIDF